MDKNMWPENLVAAPPKNPEDVRRVLDKRKTPLDAPWELLSAGHSSVPRAWYHAPAAKGSPKDPLVRIALGEADPLPHPTQRGRVRHPGKESGCLQRQLTGTSTPRPQQQLVRLR